MENTDDLQDANDASPHRLDTQADPHTSRRQQKYPVLTDSEMARVTRFGDVCHWHDGARIFKVADPGFGMYLVLSGKIKVTRRDAFGR